MSGHLVRRRMAVATAVTLITISGCGQNDTNLEQNVEKATIRVGVPESVDAAPLYLARQEGYFAEVGLSVDIVEIPANEAQARLESDDDSNRLDIALGDYVPIFQELADGAKLRILAEGYAAGPGVLQIMTAPAGPIRSIRELEGKKVAIDPSYQLGLLSLAQTLASNSVIVVSDEGLSLPDGLPVTVVPTPFNRMATALESGAVDAAWMIEPYVSAAEQTIGARELADGAAGSLAELPLSGYVVTENWARHYPGTSAAFVAALQKAQSLAGREPGMVRTILPSYTKTTKVTAALVGVGSFPTANNASRLQRVVDLMTRYQMLENELIIHDFVGPALPETASVPPSEPAQ